MDVRKGSSYGDFMSSRGPNAFSTSWTWAGATASPGLTWSSMVSSWGRSPKSRTCSWRRSHLHEQVARHVRRLVELITGFTVACMAPRTGELAGFAQTLSALGGLPVNAMVPAHSSKTPVVSDAASALRRRGVNEGGERRSRCDEVGGEHLAGVGANVQSVVRGVGGDQESVTGVQGEG